MKKVLSVLLATLMFLTLLMPLSVFAENGPYPIDWGTITEEELENLETMALISLVDYDTSEIAYVYPQVFADVMPVSVKGIAYDEKSNTLTLKNVKTDNILVLTAMGDDFKIRLNGYNELGCIVSSDLEWGGSVTVTGNGVLVVNKNKTFPSAVELDFSGTGYGFFKTEKTTAVRFFGTSSSEEINPSVGVMGTKESDPSKVIILNGTTNAEKTEVYPVYVYEQEKVYIIEKFETEGYGEFLVSNDAGNENKVYFGRHGSETGSYDVYEIVFDTELNSNMLVPVEGLIDVYPEDYNMKELTDTSKVPEMIVSISDEAVDMNKCIDANGNEAVFVDNSEYIIPLEDVEVYKVVKHSKYGKVAITVNPSKNYKELKIVKEKTTYNHVNYTQILTVNKIVTSVPGKVTLKKATSAYGGVNVTWNAVSGADSYTIYRKAAGAKSWSTLGTSKTTSYLDKTAKTGTKYTYTVRAKNIVGLGSYDKTGVSTTYIAAPTVKIANASNGIKVSWNKISGATGYTVYRSEYANGKWSGWKNMGTAKASASSWTDKSVKSGVAYKYTVRTLSNKLASSYKASSAIRFLSVPTVKIQNASTGVKVTWNKISGAKNYIIYRSEYNASTKKWSSWKNLGTVGAVTSHIDTTASSGVYYKYTVRAVNGGSKGVYKESAQLLYLAQPTTKIANASNGIKVSWTKSAGTKGYTIYRSEYNATTKKWSGWKNMGNTNAKISAWTDKSVKDGVQYRYTVRAVNGKVKSTYKATAGLVRLAQPTVKVALNENSVKVSWNKISGAKSYKVYRSELVDGNWTSWVVVSSQTAVAYTDSAVTEGATYRYTVRAVNGKSSSSYKASNVVTITGDKEIIAPAQ